MAKVTDPALLAELEGGEKKVTDPALLSQLEGGAAAPADDWVAQERDRVLGDHSGKEWVAEERERVLGKNANAGWRGARDLVTLGYGDELNAALQALVSRREGESLADAYRRHRTEDRAETERVKKEAPERYHKGQLAGFLATLPLGAVGGLKGMAAMGGAAGLGGSDADLSPLLEGRLPEGREAARAGLSTGAGAALGVGAGLLGEYVLAPALGSAAPALEGVANRSAAKALSGTAGEYKALGKEGAEELGAWLREKGAVTAGRSRAGVGEKVLELEQEAGSALGDVIKKLDDAGVSIDPAVLRDKLLNAAIEAEKRGPGAAAQTRQLLRAAEGVEKRMAETKGAPLSVSEAELWKRGFQDVAYPRGQKPVFPTPAQATDMEIARLAKEAVEESTDQAVTGLSRARSGDTAGALRDAVAKEGEDLGQAFRAAKTDYSMATRGAKMLRGAEGRAMGRNFASPSDKAAMLAHLATGGDPVTAALLGALNNQVRSRAASTVSSLAGLGSRAASLAAKEAPAAAAATERSVAPAGWGTHWVAQHAGLEPTDEERQARTNEFRRISELARSSPETLGRYAPAFQKAAQEGDQALAVLHQQLAQRDDGYRLMLRRLVGQGER